MALAAPVPDESAGEFLEAYCIKCHGPDKAKGKVTLHHIGADFSEERTADQWIEVLDQLTSEDMPPEDEEKQPGSAERERMIEWIG